MVAAPPRASSPLGVMALAGALPMASGATPFRLILFRLDMCNLLMVVLRFLLPTRNAAAPGPICSLVGIWSLEPVRLTQARPTPGAAAHGQGGRHGDTQDSLYTLFP